MENVRKLLDQATEKLGALARSGQVIGEPIEAGGSAVVPLCELKLGLGGGGGGGEGEGVSPHSAMHGYKTRKGAKGKGRGSGGAAGGMARVTPVALLVIEPDGARIEKLD